MLKKKEIRKMSFNERAEGYRVAMEGERFKLAQKYLDVEEEKWRAAEELKKTGRLLFKSSHSFV